MKIVYYIFLLALHPIYCAAQNSDFVLKDSIELISYPLSGSLKISSSEGTYQIYDYLLNKACIISNKGKVLKYMDGGALDRELMLRLINANNEINVKYEAMLKSANLYHPRIEAVFQTKDITYNLASLKSIELLKNDSIALNVDYFIVKRFDTVNFEYKALSTLNPELNYYIMHDLCVYKDSVYLGVRKDVSDNTPLYFLSKWKVDNYLYKPDRLMPFELSVSMAHYPEKKLLPSIGYKEGYLFLKAAPLVYFLEDLTSFNYSKYLIKDVDFTNPLYPGNREFYVFDLYVNNGFLEVVYRIDSTLCYESIDMLKDIAINTKKIEIPSNLKVGSLKLTHNEEFMIMTYDKKIIYIYKFKK